MKTKLFNKLIKLAAFAPALAFAQDANLTLDGFNSYYNTYSNSTKNITGIEIEIGADGSNSNNYISSDFEVSLYLLPCNASGSVTSSTPISLPPIRCMVIRCTRWVLIPSPIKPLI